MMLLLLGDVLVHTLVCLHIAGLPLLECKIREGRELVGAVPLEPNSKCHVLGLPAG